MDLLTYLLTGVVAGIMAGMLGIGGGLVIVPALALSFSSQGFAAAVCMHFAVGTSLATIIPTSISSLLAHQRRGSVHWRAIRGLVPGIVPGALAGAWLARQISSSGLALLFGVFEILVALHLLLGKQAAAHRTLPGAAGLGTAGAAIGSISAMLGIGGGTLTVPYLIWHRLDIRHAVGTAAACGLPIALAGATGFIIAGLTIKTNLEWVTGFIYWPAALAIIATSVLFAPLGARLAHSLPRETLRRVFALLLLLLGLKMLFGS